MYTKCNNESGKHDLYWTGQVEKAGLKIKCYDCNWTTWRNRWDMPKQDRV